MSTLYCPESWSAALEKSFPTVAPILLGNSYPMPLMQRPALVEPRPLAELRALAASHPVRSFWGHGNTVEAANAILGCDITPLVERPALRLSPEKLPTLDGVSYSTVWVLSPALPEGYRHREFGNVLAELIKGWTVLRISFTF